MDYPRREMSRPRPVLLAALITTALLAGGASAAQARTQYYLAVVQPSELQPGQTKGLPVYVDFDLVGKRCPLGPRCFRHATVRRFGTVDWAFPNCPDVLDQLSDYTPAVPVKRKRPHRFHISGQVDNDPSYHIEASGRFPHHGRIAKGWFQVTDTPSGCTSGRIYWTAHRDQRAGP
jgi:hypothetical protein